MTTPSALPLLILVGSIVAEVGATLALRLSDGLTRPWPTLAALVGYVLALGGLAIASKSIPLSVSYTLWAGLGTAGALLAARVLFHERLSAGQWAGAALVVLGVVLMRTLGERVTS
jgi:multidrug transporter EmrE-like cation transporter